MIIVGNSAICQRFTQFQQSLLSNKLSFLNNSKVLPFVKPSAILPMGFYCSQIGFFCKKEIKFESATGIPLKFRLGNYQYNDWLEGKRNAGILPVK